MADLFGLIEKGDVEGVRRVLEEKKKLPGKRLAEELVRKDGLGRTFLHAAIEIGSLPIIQELLAAGVPVDAHDRHGKTPLHIAVERGSMEIIKKLLAKDASLTEVDGKGKTVCQIAEERGLHVRGDDSNYQKIAALLRTRQEWQNKAAGFKFNRVVDMISKIFPAVELAEHKEVVLLLGGTGVGKSALVNHLNGVQYAIGTDEADKPFLTPVAGKEYEIAKIGEEMDSQTLYPQVVSKSGLPFVYCDLAGLSDSRGTEICIIETNSLQILSRFADKIKGILVVLDKPGFNSEKGQSFRKTAVALAKIVKRDPTLMGSVRFVVTKFPPRVTGRAIIDRYVSSILRGGGKTVA